jgi:tol-pal system protein YbgF
MLFTLLSGCVAQQADLKQTERALQQKIKQQDDQLSQTRARQSQEISTLRDQELPQIHGELEKVRHEAQDLQAKQEDMKHRSSQLEQQTRQIELQTKKLEQVAAKLESDTNTRYVWLQKSLDTQDAKVNDRLNRLSEDVSKSINDMKTQLEVALKKNNEELAKRVGSRIEEQHKGLADNQHRLDEVAQKFTQFNLALTGFKEALNGLNDRVGQEEQASKGLASKLDTRLDAGSRETAAYVNDACKSMAGYVETVKKSVDSVAHTLDAMNQKVVARFEDQDHRLDALSQKVVSRFEDQDHRLDTLMKSVEQINQKVDVAQSVSSQRHSLQLASAPESNGSDLVRQESEQRVPPNAQQVAPAEDPQAMRTAPSVLAAPVEAPAVEAARPAVAADRAQYERVLALFRDGDLEGARRGFTAFIASYPNSDLAPNARYWLGEAYYGAKDFKRAIDAYDKVESDYPRSEKVPAAILKKGYAYLALKDKKRASSAFKQVVTLYPRSPEAGKASDKLVQLKEGR